MKYLVIGYGISGLGSLKLLKKRGLELSVYDAKAPSGSTQTFLKSHNISCFHDFEHQDIFCGVTHVIVSPGVPPTHPVLFLAEKKSLPLYSELDLAFSLGSRSSEPNENFDVIAVTGTNGKSTTTALIHHILQSLGQKSCVGGNIGTSVAEIASEDKLLGICVLELSSYQLHYTQNMPITTAVITNLTPDHLSWHGSLNAYYQSKAKIIRFLDKKRGSLILMQQAASEFAREKIAFSYPRTQIIPTPFSLAKQEESKLGMQVSIAKDKIELEAPFGNWIINAEDIQLRGTHNLENVAMALSAVISTLRHRKNTKLPDQNQLLTAINSFPGLAHRYQFLGYWRGLEIINDSKATNIEATLTALNSSPEGVYLLLGGQHKGGSFLPILQFRHKVQAIFAFGAARDEIFNELHDKLTVIAFESLKSLLGKLPSMDLRRNGMLLLSPGCASFDEFRNFEDRGEVFTAAMKKLK